MDLLDELVKRGDVVTSPEMKVERERGFYMHPELFGAGLEKSVATARQPGMKLTKKMHSTRTRSTSRTP